MEETVKREASQSVSHAKWMEELNKNVSDFGNKKLSEIVIPGTHDSGCYGWSVSKLSTTQGRNIGQQLEGGIRFFDLRFKKSSSHSDFIIHHGIENTETTLAEVIASVDKFMGENKKEIVILSLTAFEWFKSEDYHPFFSRIWKVLSRHGFAKRPTGIPTYNELLNANTRIILRTSDEFTKPTEYADFLWDPIYSPYDTDTFTTEDASIVKRFIENEFSKTAGTMWVAQGILTPKFWSGLFTKGPEYLSHIINPQLEKWLLSREWKNKINVVISDHFLDSFVDTIIDLNSAGKMGGLFWSDDKKIRTFGMGDSPSMAVFKDRLYLAHHGYDNNSEIWITSTADGENWADDKRVGTYGISFSPSLAVFKDRLYLAHHGYGNNFEIWITSTADGENWADDKRVGTYGISFSPSLAVFKDRLYLAHHGYDNNREIWITSTADGEHWADDKRVGTFGMTDSPSLAVFQDRLYLAHHGYDNNMEIWITSTADGERWADDKRVENIGISFSPSLTVFQGKLYLAHHGSDFNGEIFYTYFDGKDWARDRKVPGVRLAFSPNIAQFQGKLYLAHQGMGDSDFGPPGISGDKGIWYLRLSN